MAAKTWKMTWLWAGLAAVLLVPAYLRTAQTTPVPIGDSREEANAVLRIMFGVGRHHPKTWDGEITLDRGTVRRLRGVFFEHQDAILGDSRWKLTSRATNYMDSTSPRGYDPVHTKPWELIPNGIVAVLDAPANARVSVKTASGNFAFSLDRVSMGKPSEFLDGDVTIERIPPTVALTRQPGENDYPSLAVDSRGDLWAGWISYADRKDAVWVARRTASGWEPPTMLSGDLTDNFRTALVEDGQKRMWLIWSAKGGEVWGLYGRYFSDGKWSPAMRITGDEGPNLYHAAVRDSKGRLHVVWQGFRRRRSQILMKTWDGQAWPAETRVSTGESDYWVPSAAEIGRAHV